jgi:hypothetical protein
MKRRAAVITRAVTIITRASERCCPRLALDSPSTRTRESRIRRDYVTQDRASLFIASFRSLDENAGTPRHSERLLVAAPLPSALLISSLWRSEDSHPAGSN